MMQQNTTLQCIALIKCLVMTQLVFAETKLFDSTEPGYWGIQIENDILRVVMIDFIPMAFRLVK